MKTKHSSLIKASSKNKQTIYNLWRATGRRILGLDKSIEDGDVYVYSYVDYDSVIGFVRVKMSEGSTLDYLHIHEIFLADWAGINVVGDFLWMVDKFIIECGYIKAKTLSGSASISSMLEAGGWDFESDRYTYSKDNKSSYTNRWFVRKIYDVKKVEKFGNKLR